MLTPDHLEVAADGLTAILGIWLGLTVLTRSRAPSARIFAFLSLALVAWSSSVIVQRLSGSVSAVQVAHAVEELSAALILPATAQLSLVIATEGRPTRRQRQVLALAFLLNIAFAIPGALDPAAPISIGVPGLSVGPVPGAFLGWTWIAIRLATLLGSAGWLLSAWRRTTADDPRRRQLGVTLLTVAVGAVGGIIRLFSVVAHTDPWIGVSLVTLAMILAASVVFSGRVFFEPEVAGRAFWTTLGRGFSLFLLVGLLLAVDAASRRLLELDIPLATILAFVVAIALYEPAATWSRARSNGRSPSALARARLLAAIGDSALTARGAEDGVQPALFRLTQALDLSGAEVLRQDGSIAARQGNASDPASTASIALVSDDEVVGQLRLGPTRSGAALDAGDRELLRLSTAYVAAAIRTGRREDEQAQALTGLTAERANVESVATDMYEALVRRSSVPVGLRIYALGPLRVYRGTTPVERWGGEKAGSRQAQALFAFLYDRGERGVAKDEALELIWPDMDLERADLAFHRTLGGLRHTLDPDAAGGKRAIRFRNDRYRLDPGQIEWSDVSAFQACLDRAREATDRAASVALLQEARSLYRGEYLDDCPFYGDSVHVEERRRSLRDRSIDLSVALGANYEASGDRLSAAAAYREALAAALDGCPPAEAGLARLAAPV